MGYTHYYTPKKVTDDQWENFIDTVKKLYKAIPDTTIIKDGFGEDQPIFGSILPELNKPAVWFNGDASQGLEHETFLILKNDLKWQFCKTARKPYDFMVCLTLLAARDILKFDVSSDGNIDDWLPAIRFYVDQIFDNVTKEDIIEFKILPEKFENSDFEL